MNKVRVATLLTAMSPSVAFATDYSGAAAILGIPLMSAALLIYGLLAVFPKLPALIYTIASVLFVPLMLIGVFAAVDGVANLGTSHAYYSYIYYALFIAVAVCFWVMRHQRQASRPVH